MNFSTLTDLQPVSKFDKALIPALVSVFKDFEGKFSAMFSELKENLVSVLSSEVTSLKKKVAILEEKIDDQEAYERRDTIVLSGKSLPPVGPDENTITTACKLFQEKLRIVVDPTEISVAHRLGRKPISQRPDTRKIIIKFCRRNTKVDLLAAARRMKVPEFFLNESLTPTRQSIHFALRKAKRECPEIVSGTNTFDGKVFVWVKPPNPGAPGARNLRTPINSYAQLENFCTRTLNLPATRFWPESSVEVGL